MCRSAANKPAGRRYRLEGADATEDFPAVVARHPDRGDLASLLVDVEIRRACDVRASVREVHGALGVLREAAKKLVADADDFVRLPAGAGDLARHDHVLAVPEHAAERVAGQRSRTGLVPGHDHPGVHASGERHPDALPRFEVPRQVLREDGADLARVGFRFEDLLLLPLPRVEVAALSLEDAVAEHPGGAAGQHVNVREERPVLEDAAARDELAQPAEVRAPAFRPHGEDGFGFGGEIEGVFGVVVVDAVHAVPVVEERRRAAGAIREQPVKPSVQAGRKPVVLFGQVHEVLASAAVEPVSAPLEPASGVWLGELLSREDEHGRAPLVFERHPIREGTLEHAPSDVHAQRLVDPGAGAVQRPVAERLQHPRQLTLRVLGRKLGDETGDSRHVGLFAGGQEIRRSGGHQDFEFEKTPGLLISCSEANALKRSSRRASGSALCGTAPARVPARDRRRRGAGAGGGPAVPRRSTARSSGAGRFAGIRCVP